MTAERPRPKPESEPPTSGLAASPDAKARAFRRIFDEHASYVHHSLRRLGVRESELADAVQEVFVVFFRRWDDFDPSRSPKLWLFGIALRVAMQERRRVKPNEPLDDEQPLADDAPLADAQLEDQQARELVLRALDAIPLERRAVFVMHEIDGFDVPAIAEELGVGVNTAYSRLRLAREDFRRAADRLRKKEGAR